MSQCYSVAAQFLIKDEAKFVRKGCEVLNLVASNPKELIEYLLVKKQHNFRKDGSVYYSGFNASYSWESLLYDFFNNVREALKPGSFIEVFPDVGSWKEEVNA